MEIVKVTRILIEGIGGIGGIVAAALIKTGYAVTLVTNNAKITDAISTEGIRIRRKGEEVSFFTTAHTSLKDLPTTTKYDIIFLVMKADHVEEAAKQSLPYLGDSGYMTTFQNGVVEDRVASIVGEQRVVPVTVGFGGTMIAPGIYEKTSAGGFHIGELHGTPTRRIAELKKILEYVDEVVVSDNMIGVLWSKLAINCTINTLGAISGSTLGELLSQKKIRSLFLRIYTEVANVAHQKNIELERITGDPYRFYLPEDATPFTKFVKDKFLILVGRRYRNLKSSTLQSIERGRKSEIDILNGYIVEQAKLVGLDAPANLAVTEIMNLIDDGQLTYNPKNIDLVFDKLE